MAETQSGEGPNDNSYALGRSAAERSRLILQEHVIGSSTAAFLNRAGVARGMRVLDIGSGSGDVAMRVAGLVGPAGSVLGVEIDDASVQIARDRAAAAGISNVKFVTADVMTADLGSGFDALIGRLVLMHVADPVKALRRLAVSLRPGGLVAFQEAHLEAAWLSFPTSPTLQHVQRLRDLALQQGQPVYFQMGLALRSAFVRAGLAEPEIRADLVVGGGPDWAGFELVETTVRSLRPGWLRLGVDGADEIEPDGLADRLRAEIGRDGLLAMYPLINASSHTPS